VELTGRNNALAFTPPDRDAGAGARAKPSAKKLAHSATTECASAYDRTANENPD